MSKKLAAINCGKAKMGKSQRSFVLSFSETNQFESDFWFDWKLRYLCGGARLIFESIVDVLNHFFEDVRRNVTKRDRATCVFREIAYIGECLKNQIKLSNYDEQEKAFEQW
jgi:hypothetical protein